MYVAFMTTTTNLTRYLITDKYRPVLILGPLSECVIEKLCIDFPENFYKCQQNQVRCTKEEMENGIQNNTIADYHRRGSMFEYTSIQTILDNKVCTAD